MYKEELMKNILHIEDYKLSIEIIIYIYMYI